MVQESVMSATQPYLQVDVQPQSVFRFRYISEMNSRHGCLQGETSLKSSRKSFPTVQLKNYSGNDVKIACQVYTEDGSKLHVNTLYKDGQHYEHNPVIVELTPHIAVFRNMSIIQADKRSLQKAVKRKRLHEEGRDEFSLTLGEQYELNSNATHESHAINLHRVRLRFAAVRESPRTGMLEEICSVMSNIIIDHKDPGSGKLRVTDWDKYSGSHEGNEKMIILTERVKNNLKVEFFELNNNEEIVWQQFATDCTVHHGTAVKFKTPPYPGDATTKKKVFFRLYRTEDKATSDPLSFIYESVQKIQYPSMLLKQEEGNTCLPHASNYIGNSYSQKQLSALGPQQTAAIPEIYTAVDQSQTQHKMLLLPQIQHEVLTLSHTQHEVLILPQPSASQSNMLSPATQMNTLPAEVFSPAAQNEVPTTHYSPQVYNHSMVHSPQQITQDITPVLSPESPMSRYTGTPTAMETSPQSIPSVMFQQLSPAASPLHTLGNQLSPAASPLHTLGNQLSSVLPSLPSNSSISVGTEQIDNSQILQDPLLGELNNIDTNSLFSMVLNSDLSNFFIDSGIQCDGDIGSDESSQFLQEEENVKKTDTQIMSKLAALMTSGDLSKFQTEDGENLIHAAVHHAAVHHNWQDIMKFILNKLPVGINGVNHLKQTPLHLAVLCKKAHLVCLLLQYGANPNKKDITGNTPCHLAIELNLFDCLMELLNRNNYQNHEELYPNLQIHNSDGNTLLHMAVSCKYLNYVTLLCSAGAPINLTDINLGRTPLNLAAETRHEDITKFLLQKPGIEITSDYELDPDSQAFLNMHLQKCSVKNSVISDEDVNSFPHNNFKINSLPKLTKLAMANLLDQEARWRKLIENMNLKRIIKVIERKSSPTVSFLEWFEGGDEENKFLELLEGLKKSEEEEAANILVRVLNHGPTDPAA